MVNGIAAFGFSTFNFRFKGILYAFVLVSFMVPFEGIAVPLYSTVNSPGWVNSYPGLIVP